MKSGETVHWQNQLRMRERCALNKPPHSQDGLLAAFGESAVNPRHLFIISCENHSLQIMCYEAQQTSLSVWAVWV